MRIISGGSLEVCNKAVKVATKKLTSNVLIHYNHLFPIRLATVASKYEIGAVLSHLSPKGAEKPIAFAFQTLSKSIKN